MESTKVTPAHSTNTEKTSTDDGQCPTLWAIKQEQLFYAPAKGDTSQEPIQMFRQRNIIVNCPQYSQELYILEAIYCNILLIFCDGWVRSKPYKIFRNCLKKHEKQPE